MMVNNLLYLEELRRVYVFCDGCIVAQPQMYAQNTNTTTAMKYRLKQRAVKLCMQTQEEYAKCCSDKVFSVVWACRKELQAFSDCCHAQYVVEEGRWGQNTGWLLVCTAACT